MDVIVDGFTKLVFTNIIILQVTENTILFIPAMEITNPKTHKFEQRQYYYHTTQYSVMLLKGYPLKNFVSI